MEDNNQMMERLEAATSLLERALTLLQERQGEVERISATVEQTKRELALADKLAAAERELADLIAAAVHESSAQHKTEPTKTTKMLAKHGFADGPVDVRALD